MAIKKAKTSALFEMETQTLDNYSKAGADAHGIELTNGHLVTFAGGIPLKGVDGQIIGSIGMSRAGGSRLRSCSKRSIKHEAFQKVVDGLLGKPEGRLDPKDMIAKMVEVISSREGKIFLPFVGRLGQELPAATLRAHYPRGNCGER